mgnify:CR=1 FL=1
MFHLKLVKGLSYSGDISATRQKPDAYTEDEAIAKKAVASGIFKLVEDTDENGNSTPEGAGKAHLDREQLESMKMDGLKKLAADMGIDTKALKSKVALVEAIAAVEVEPGQATDEDGNEADLGEEGGSPTMIELQQEQ